MLDLIENSEIAMWWIPDLVLQYFAIAGPIVAAFFAGWRYWTADRSLGQEQFHAAADHLGKETSGETGASAIIRISSVVTLGRLARSYPAEFHVVVMGIFATYLGRSTTYNILESDDADAKVESFVVAPDADSTREVIKFIEETDRKTEKDRKT